MITGGRPRWVHPPLEPGWIDRPHERLSIGDLPLESGETILDCEISYVVHGTINAARDNVVLGLTAIGSTHHRLDDLIGPARPLDPARYCTIVVDAIGNGLSTSPSNSQKQSDLAFPRFGLRDMVESQRRLLDALGIGGLAAVVGASMGGMQALQWGVSHPRRVGRLVAIVPMARTRSWSIAMNEAARRALMADSAWPSGPMTVGLDAWAALTRVITNRSPQALEAWPAGEVVGRVGDICAAARLTGPDPVDWYYQSLAYDAHDVGTTSGFGGDTAAALRSIVAPTLLVVPGLDLYNPVEDAIEAATLINDCTLARFDRPAGHAIAAVGSAAAAEIRDVVARHLAR